MDSSLRIYIDVDAAAQIGTALKLQGLEAALSWCGHHWAWYLFQYLTQSHAAAGQPQAGRRHVRAARPGSSPGVQNVITGLPVPDAGQRSVNAGLLAGGTVRPDVSGGHLPRRR